MKLLVIGSGGQLGSKLAREAVRNGHKVYGTYLSRPPSVALEESFQLDKRNKGEVARILSSVRPDAVVDTGALHNVDYCETHPGEAMAINAEGTRNLAQGSSSVNARFVFISTDFVFDGNGAPYKEDDRPNPLSVYASSKLEGERLALENNENSAVVRPAVIYSWSALGNSQSSSSGKPLNFAMWLVSQLMANKSVNIVRDQVTSPTLADDLAAAVLAILERQKRGIFHAAGTSPLSRYDFSLKIAEQLRLDSSLIKPILSAQLKQAAKRPSNSSLISEKLRREVGYEMMNMEKALSIFADEAGAEIKR